MPMREKLRSEYMKRAGVTPAQLEESLGQFAVAELNVQATGLDPADIEAARVSVRQVQADAVIISAKYNEMSRTSRRDAREMATAEELATDRQLLDELIADEYRLTNPFGKSEGKGETINKVLSGTIRPEAFGRGAFEALETQLQIHGVGKPEAVVLQGRFYMRGSGLVQYARSGKRGWRKLTGQYRTTHAFILRDGRWMITASQMTRVPAEPTFVFEGEKEKE
jgi:hypothetical protein